MADVSIKKDRKGPCFFVSHKRCGITEGVYFTLDELREIGKLLNEIEQIYE